MPAAVAIPPEVERYIARMARLEARAVRAALAVMRATRPQLLQAIADSPGDPSAQIAILVEAAGAAVEQQLRDVAGDVATAAATVVAAQTGAQIELSAPLSMAAWKYAALAALLGELQQLRLARATPAAIVARLITGTDGRASALDRAATGLELGVRRGVWAAGNTAIIAGAEVAGRAAGVTYQKQAIASRDERTTDCCRRVNGQIRPLSEPFRLTGTPRFADQVMAPPFHWNCRSAIALWTPAAEHVGPTTRTLRTARGAL